MQAAPLFHSIDDNSLSAILSANWLHQVNLFCCITLQHVSSDSYYFWFLMHLLSIEYYFVSSQSPKTKNVQSE